MAASLGAKKVKEPKPEKYKPLYQLGTANLYHLADITGMAMRIDGHRLEGVPGQKTLDIRGFPISYQPKRVDGIVGKEYAALDIHIGGVLHLYLLVLASDHIRNFTILWISSGNPTEPLQSALKDGDEPKPLPDFLPLFDGNTKQGFWSNDRKQWAELPEAAYMDLRERGNVDNNLRKLLQG
jgi:hypothetical protein